MEYIITIVVCIVTTIVLKFAFQIKLKSMKEIKKIGYDKKLNEITNKLPENRVVCEKILENLKNDNVSIEESTDKNTLTYYSVITNHIIIANIKDTFTRIQTIAHECIHSIQNRKLLLFNFVFSNIYLLYFLITLILTIVKVIPCSMLQVLILMILGIIYYVVRDYLEIDAMTRAPYIAKEYIEESNCLTKQEIEEVIQNYNILNKMGIPMVNFELITKLFSKVIIYCVIVIIMLNIM